jgi:hypothetical protein
MLITCGPGSLPLPPLRHQHPCRRSWQARALTLPHLRAPLQANLQLVVNIAKEYTEQLSSARVVELLEGYNSYHGLYFYLGARIASSERRSAALALDPLGLVRACQP